MVQRPIGLAGIAGLSLALLGPAAQAVTCDIVIDRNGAVVYQDVVPPVDMSERGAVARDRMRQRGEQLMIIDADQCPRLVFSTITGAASVEEIVAGMRPYIGVSGGMGSSSRPGASGTISGGPTSAPGAQPISVPPGER
ncbi:MAG TPA: hypothetical protein VGH59_00860 [Casimicrobiaceae bacterium]|jgi:hypothetical protein